MTLPSYIPALATSQTVFLGPCLNGPVNTPVQISSFDDYQRHFGGLDDSMEMGFCVDSFFKNGGEVAWIIRVEGVSPRDWLGDSDAQTGIYSMALLGYFDFLSIPQLTQYSFSDSLELIRMAQVFCEKRDAMFLLDVSYSVRSVSQLQGLFLKYDVLRHANTLLYFPHVIRSVNGVPRLISVSGPVAGLFAKTDQSVGVWRAPGGTHLSLVGIDDVAFKLDNRDTIGLNQSGINCMRKFASTGVVVWGIGTLVGMEDSQVERKYISIQRTLRFVRQSIKKVIPSLQTLSDDEWQERFVTLADGFLLELFTRGAFQGDRPQEAYYIDVSRLNGAQIDELQRGLAHESDVSESLILPGKMPRFTIRIGLALITPEQYSVIDLIC